MKILLAASNRIKEAFAVDNVGADEYRQTDSRVANRQVSLRLSKVSEEDLHIETRTQLSFQLGVLAARTNTALEATPRWRVLRRSKLQRAAGRVAMIMDQLESSLPKETGMLVRSVLTADILAKSEQSPISSSQQLGLEISETGLVPEQDPSALELLQSALECSNQSPQLSESGE